LSKMSMFLMSKRTQNRYAAWISGSICYFDSKQRPIKVRFYDCTWIPTERFSYLTMVSVSVISSPNDRFWVLRDRAEGCPSTNFPSPLCISCSHVHLCLITFLDASFRYIIRWRLIRDKPVMTAKEPL
jgi:hypothetical protein